MVKRRHSEPPVSSARHQAEPPPPPPPHSKNQILRDVVLILLGAILAFAGEEWRDARQHRSRATVALTSIRSELRANTTLVERAREHHVFLADTLSKLIALHLHPGVAIYSNGMFNPALVTSTAWQAARETGALGDIPFATVLALAPAYAAQERYRALADAMAASIMTDARREGSDAVMRDRFAQFVPLEVDFGNRERVLLEEYRLALKRLASIR